MVVCGGCVVVVCGGHVAVGGEEEESVIKGEGAQAAVLDSLNT